MHDPTAYAARDERFATGTAIVAGGSGALGRAIALELARAGSDVAFTYRTNAAEADRVAQAIRALGRRVYAASLALEDAAAVQAFVSCVEGKFGALHSVVYASGPALRLQGIGEISAREWADVTNVDVNGCFNLVSHTLPLVRASRGAYVGVITAAVERVPARDALSAVPKAAVQMLMRAVAKEEGRNGVRANCVAPGWIDAGVGQRMLEELSPEAAGRVVKAIPLRRIGTPDDVASATVFLLSSRAGFVTGQTLAVDGGMQV